jgi:hypothetical protein
MTHEYEINDLEETFWAMCEEENRDDPFYDYFERAEREAMEDEWAHDTAEDQAQP